MVLVISQMRKTGVVPSPPRVRGPRITGRTEKTPRRERACRCTCPDCVTEFGELGHPCSKRTSRRHWQRFTPARTPGLRERSDDDDDGNGGDGNGGMPSLADGSEDDSDGSDFEDIGDEDPESDSIASAASDGVLEDCRVANEGSGDFIMNIGLNHNFAIYTLYLG